MLRAPQPAAPPVYRRLRSIPRVLGALLAALACACASTNLDAAYLAHEAGDFEAAAEVALSLEPKRDHDRLWVLLERGKMLQDAGRFAESTRVLREADELIEVLDESAVVSFGQVGNVTKALLTDDRSLDYTGSGFERILLATALCLNHLMTGELESAAVYARRIASRQGEAREKYEREIRQLAERERAAKREGAGVTLDSVRRGNDFQAQQERLAAWATPAGASYSLPYGDFVGAIALGAAQRLGEQRRMAEDLLGQLPDHPAVAELARLEGVESRVFVLFENGKAPLRVDRSFTYPSPLGITTVPVPDLFVRDAGRATKLRIRAGEESLETRTLDEVDRLIATEFRESLGGIWFRNVVAVVLKEVATKQLADEIGGWGILVGSLFKAVVQPDLRSWRSLPGEHQAAILERPADGRLALALVGPGGAPSPPLEVHLPPGPSLVLVRSTGANWVAHVAALSDTALPPAAAPAPPNPADRRPSAAAPSKNPAR